MARGGGPLLTRAPVVFPRDAAPFVWDHIAAHVAAHGRPPPRITRTPVRGQGGMVDEAVATGAVAPVSRVRARDAAARHAPSARRSSCTTPEYVERFRNEAHVGGKPSPFEVAAQGAGKETQPNDDPKSR